MPWAICVATASGGIESISRGRPARFFGADLAIVNEPYSLLLPAGAEFEVSWGDGAVERFPRDRAAREPVAHTYAKTGVAAVTVKARGDGGAWAAVPVDFAAIMADARPALFAEGPVPAGTILPTVLKAPADLFSVECRLRLDRPDADQVIFAARPGTAGSVPARHQG